MELKQSGITRECKLKENASNKKARHWEDGNGSLGETTHGNVCRNTQTPVSSGLAGVSFMVASSVPDLVAAGGSGRGGFPSSFLST